MVIFFSILIGFLFFIFVNSSVIFNHNIPKLVHQNTPYSLNIINTDSLVAFPFENFVLSFELLNPATYESLGIAAVTTNEYKGEDYRGFSLSEFSVKIKNINLKITFRKEAHNHKFVVRYSSEKTDSEKQQFFDDKSKGIIFENVINMYLPYTIITQVQPDMGVVQFEDKNEFGSYLIPDKYGLITCEATDGLKKITPEFLNDYILKGATVKVINIGLIGLQWKVLTSDHGKIIQCKAGDNIQNITLTVYHYISEVLTSPPLSDKLSRNSQVKCISKDGYPTPKMTWSFVRGPPESWNFYQFRDNNVTLFINSSAPVNSNWSFECRGMNEVSAVVQRYLSVPLPNYPIKKIYNFTVIDSNENVQMSQTGTVILICILVIILIAAAVFCVMKRSKIREYLFSHHSRFFKTDKQSETFTAKNEPIYKYSEGNKTESHRNGTDEALVNDIMHTTCNDPMLGPIDRV